jgi:RNA polymerase sigma-70 factor (sigma-E family)
LTQPGASDQVVTITAIDATGVGDIDGYGELFARTHVRLIRLAFLLCGDRRRAEDAVADAFARVYPRWRRGGLDDADAYLRRAVVNQLRSGWRRLLVERRHAAKAGGDDRGQVLHADQSADHAALLHALTQLTELQRTAIVLRFYEDMKETEVADAMGVPLGTVKSSVSRGLDRLRELLGEEGEWS